MEVIPALEFLVNRLRAKAISRKEYPHFLREGGAKPRPLSKNGGSGMEVMILGCVGAAHTPQNHYPLRTTKMGI